MGLDVSARIKTEQEKKYYLYIEETHLLTEGKQWKWVILLQDEEEPDIECDGEIEIGYARTKQEVIMAGKTAVERYIPAQKKPREKKQSGRWIPQIFRRN